MHTNLDMWMILSNNWDNFYWLTGEIPPTLTLLVEEIENIFDTRRTSGRNGALNFRNQVCTNKLTGYCSLLCIGKNATQKYMLI